MKRNSLDIAITIFYNNEIVQESDTLSNQMKGDQANCENTGINL